MGSILVWNAIKIIAILRGGARLQRCIPATLRAEVAPLRLFATMSGGIHILVRVQVFLRMYSTAPLRVYLYAASPLVV